MTSEYLAPFTEGHLAGDLANNPHLLTSNHSDAFVLGVWCANRSWPISQTVHKSRGYFWRVGGCLFRVDGETVKFIEGGSVDAEKLKLATKGRKRAKVDQSSVCGLPLFEPGLL